MDDDLFSVFEKPDKSKKQPSPAPANGTDAEPRKKKKRDRRTPSAPVEGSPAPVPASKKPKVDETDAEASTSAAPVLADEFKTEAQRKVTASGGLQGKVDGEDQVVLSHQVRLVAFYFLEHLVMRMSLAGPPPSRGAA
jgi:hypothetical protein